MRIGNEWIIESDDTSWIVKKICANHNKKTGETYEAYQNSYFASLIQAVDYVFNRMIGNRDDVRKLRREVIRSRNILINTINNHFE